MPHTKQVESLKQRSSKWRSSKRYLDAAMLSSAYPVHRSASKVNHLGADTKVASCHGYVVSHPFVEQLTCLLCLWTCSGIVFYSPSPRPQLQSQWHHELHVPKRYINPSMWQGQYEKPPCVLWILHSCINKIKFYLSNPVYFNCKPVTDRHTYKHNLRLGLH